MGTTTTLLYFRGALGCAGPAPEAVGVSEAVTDAARHPLSELQWGVSHRLCEACSSRAAFLSVNQEHLLLATGLMSLKNVGAPQHGSKLRGD